MLSVCYSDTKIEAGCDEAGRGCLAGPVFAAAVILPRDYSNEFLDDSKKINSNTRYKLRENIENDAIAWAVASYSPEEIDEVNILNASIYSMHRALDKLKIKPELLLIDGNKFKEYNGIPYKCIIKGDGKYMSIAAASVLAKTYRDDYMIQMHQKFPNYRWDKNKGYPTPEHKIAIRDFGVSELHRKSFNCNIQLKMDF